MDFFCKKENCKQICIGKTETKLKEHVNAVKKNEGSMRIPKCHNKTKVESVQLEKIVD